MDPYGDPIGAAAQGQRGTPTQHASDWGLGSLLMAMTMLLLAPWAVAGLALLPILLREGGPADLGLFGTLADLVGYGFLAIAALTTLFALVGLISGFVRGQPVGLPTAALVLSILNLALWIVLFFGVMEIKREIQFRRNFLDHPERRRFNDFRGDF
jgi:hypothetical protein